MVFQKAGAEPRAIFSARARSTGWSEGKGTRDYTHAFFDESAGVAYVSTAGGEHLIKIASGIAETIPDLSVLIGDPTRSMRIVPEIGGTLALMGKPGSPVRASSFIWFKPDGGNWGHVDIKQVEGERLLASLEGPPFILTII